MESFFAGLGNDAYDTFFMDADDTIQFGNLGTNTVEFVDQPGPTTLVRFINTGGTVLSQTISLYGYDDPMG